GAVTVRAYGDLAVGVLPCAVAVGPQAAAPVGDGSGAVAVVAHRSVGADVVPGPVTVEVGCPVPDDDVARGVATCGLGGDARDLGDGACELGRDVRDGRVEQREVREDEERHGRDLTGR